MKDNEQIKELLKENKELKRKLKSISANLTVAYLYGYSKGKDDKK